MKQHFLKYLFPLALCAFLVITLLAVFSPARAAATTSATCSNLNIPQGYTWLPNSIPVVERTCKGATLHLQFQDDGNFVLYINGQSKWASNTTALYRHGVYTEFQTNGNLVVYDFDTLFSNQQTFPAWSSGTYGGARKGVQLLLQDDGNLVIYNAQHQPVWASGTSGY